MSRTYLSKRGYVVVKKYFSDDLLKQTRKDLTVKPFVADDYGMPPQEFKIYGENTNKLYIPKFYGFEKFGKPDFNHIPIGESISLKFNGNLRPNQIESFNVTIKALREIGGGTLSLPCGEGKTAISLKILTEISCKTLIIVHKEFLLNQWIERIEQFIPEARIGIIQQDKIDIENKDIVIGMLQSISMKEYAMTTFDSFGMLIIDECHHISSRIFSQALRKTNCHYMLGLSATPIRKDGLTKVFEWHVGGIVYSKKHEDINVVHVERLIIKSNNEYYNQECVNYKGKVMMPKMVTNITENMNRSKIILHWIKELINENRKILILSDRRAHLEDFYKLVKNSGINSVGYYVGGMKQSELDKSSKKSVILGTYAISSEGLDIPELDTLILASPKSDIIQSVGRILRKQHEIPPKIIDIVDKFSVFEGQAEKRKKLYKSRNYIIDDITLWDELENDEPKIISKNRYIYKNTNANPKTKTKTKTNPINYQCMVVYDNDNLL